MVFYVGELAGGQLFLNVNFGYEIVNELGMTRVRKKSDNPKKVYLSPSLSEQLTQLQKLH